MSRLSFSFTTEVQLRWQIPMLLILSVALLTMKVDSLDYYPGKFLWAEDGTIFINDAQEFGLISMLKPYAGYLHFYSRGFSYIASYFDILYRPLVMLFGWFIAYFVMISCVANTAKNLKFGWISSVSAVSFIVLQPHNGENFFNITNSQWMLGAALIFIALSDVSKPAFLRGKIAIFLMTFVMGLSGPFSIILAAFLMLRALIIRGLKDGSVIYFAVFLSAAIQIIVFALSDRGSSVEISIMPWNWFMAFSQMFLFGANSMSVMCGALIFWAICFGEILKAYYARKKWADDIALPMAMLVMAILVIGAALYSHKNNPLAVVSLGVGNRYTWIPYALAFFAALALSIERLVPHILLLAIATFICGEGAQKVASNNLQFGSFARLSEVTDVIIPINPMWPSYPGWHIKGYPSGVPSNKFSLSKIYFSDGILASSGVKILKIADDIRVDSVSTDPYIVLKNKLRCDAYSDVAIEFLLTRASDGWTQLFWDENGVFSEAKSLRRWYPSGAVRVQFAFPIPKEGLFMRIDPSDVSGDIKISPIKIYCF